MEAPLASFVSGLLLTAIFAVAGRRSGAPLTRPGGWFTTRPLASAVEGRPGLDGDALTLRLVLETALWVVLACGWVVLADQSHDIAFATGIAAAAFGVIQGVAGRKIVLAEQGRRDVEFVVAERRAIGTPSLGVRPT